MTTKKTNQYNKDQSQQSKKFIIPKGYKGIRSNITLQLNSNLAVITGLNGSGKTTLLKYIYEQCLDKKEIFFKTQKVEYFENERSYRRIGARYRNSSGNPTFDDLYQEIIEFFKKNNRQLYTHHHEMFSMLFDESSTLYDQGYGFLEKLADIILSDFDDPKNIKQRLGVPIEESIEKAVIKEINREIQENEFKYPHSKGKTVYNLYRNNSTEPNIILKIRGIEQNVTTKLRETCRKKSSIRDRNSFESYLFELISNNSFSVESIVQQLSRRIYEDAKAKGPRTKKLWEELNEELQKYKDKKQFNYDVVAPSIYSSNYEITFTSWDGKEVHFDSLSSGEKIVFELVCYYFLSRSNNKNLKMIILDEFDANLNPALAEMYLSVVREQFCNNGIVTLLTTHSPSTVVEVDPKDLFSVSIENENQIITCAKNEDGKKSILKKLAPKFAYYGEFGILEYVLTDKNNVIVFTEGKKDCENFDSLKDKFTFIDCDGAGNIKTFIQCLKVIPFLKDGIKNKTVIALFDFDEEGRQSIQAILSSDSTKNDDFTMRLRTKKPLFIQDRDNIFLSMLTPPPSDNYDYRTCLKSIPLLIA